MQDSARCALFSTLLLKSKYFLSKSSSLDNVKIDIVDVNIMVAFFVCTAAKGAVMIFNYSTANISVVTSVAEYLVVTTVHIYLAVNAS